MKSNCPSGHDLDLWNKNGKCYACQKDKYLKSAYDITLNEFIMLYEFQKGLCACCLKPLISYLPKLPGVKGRIEVDHDHRKGRKKEAVRGLLCGGRWTGCNRKLGRIDNPEWLQNAANYIKSPPAQKVFK